MEPVRRLGTNFKLYIGRCDGIDFTNKTLVGNSLCLASDKDEAFAVSFDRLVIACGSISNTFNIPGVDQHAFFLKDVQDARKLRRRIIDCSRFFCLARLLCLTIYIGFEHAQQPNVAEAECRELLHFAIVGGGPTGVEISAERNVC